MYGFSVDCTIAFFMTSYDRNPLHESMTSSHHVDTFITGNGDNETNNAKSANSDKRRQRNDVIKVSELLTNAEDTDDPAADNRRFNEISVTTFVSGCSTQRRVTAEATESTEREANEMRELNRRMSSEMNELRHENGDLLRQLDQVRRERDVAEQRVKQLTLDVRRLDAELCDRKREFELETIKAAEKERRLHDALGKCDELRAELDRKSADWKSFVERHNEEMRAAAVEHDALKTRLEQLTISTAATSATSKSSRSRKGDGAKVDVEMQHELEALKRDKCEMAAVRDQLNRDNRKLAIELQNLATVLADRENELRKERTRHVLLTRQFNSLLDENTALKGKRQVKSIQQQLTQINHVPDTISDISLNFTNAPGARSATKNVSSRSTDARKNNLNVDVKSTSGSMTSSSPPTSRLSRETTRDSVHVTTSRDQTPEVTGRCRMTSQHQRQLDQGEGSLATQSSRSAAASKSRLHRTTTQYSVRPIFMTSLAQGGNSAASVSMVTTAATATTTAEEQLLPIIQQSAGGVTSGK